jgi:MFS family permease
MKGKVLGMLRDAVALLLGLFFGFFLVVNSLFTDIFTFKDRAVFTVIVLTAYALLGFIFGFLSPARGWRWVFWLAGFAVIFFFYFIVSALINLDAWVIFLVIYSAGVFGCTAAGAYLGKKLRTGSRTVGE